jgi:hypothetical protein
VKAAWILVVALIALAFLAGFLLDHFTTWTGPRP